MPKAFRYSGSRVKPVEGTVQVILPDDFEDLSEEAKDRVREEQFDAIVREMYFATMKFNPKMHTLLAHPQFPIMLEPFTSALESWNRGLEELQFHLVVLSANWEGLADDEKCPLPYNEENSSEILRNFERFAVYQGNFTSLCELLGCDGYGCVTNEVYDTLWTAITQLKSAWVTDERGGPYPFELEIGDDSR